MAIPALFGAGGMGGLSALLAGGQAGAMPAAGAGTVGGGNPSFWAQFAQMYGGSGATPQINSARPPASGGGQSSNPYTDKLSQMGVPGVDLITAYLDNLENRTGRLSEMVRGPTMPFLPKLNTSQVGPNINPGQIGLAQLLSQIATRRG